MALIECSECKQKISSNAAFCPHCGNPRESQKVLKEKAEQKEERIIEKNDNICPNCGFSNKKDSIFCSKCGKELNTNLSRKVICKNCGNKNGEDELFCKKCGQSLKEKKKGWNFNNTFLSITFFFSALFGVLIFGSDEFRRQVWFVKDWFIFSNTFLTILTISIAVIIILVAFIKDGFSIKNEIDHLKHCKFSKIQAAIIFLLAGILIFCHVGLTTHRSDYYFYIPILFTLNFIMMSITALVLNYRMIGWILDGLILVASIASFYGAFLLFDEADSHRGNFFDELRYIYYGERSEYNELKSWGTFLLILGIILLILFIVLIIVKIVKYTKNKNKDVYLGTV